jgi:hypothetical protein
MMMPVMGLGGAAFDYSRASAVRDVLQSAVDTAAIAGVSAKVPLPSQRETLARNTFGAVNVTGITVRPGVEIGAKRAVVSAVARVPTIVLGLAQVPQLTVAVRATAVRAYDGPPPCLLALNATARGALSVSGGAQVDASGCVIHSNSTSAGAVEIGAAATVSARSVCATGTANAARKMTPEPDSYCEPLDDPFQSLAAPKDIACRYRDVVVKPGETAVLDPGVYCGGLELRGTVTLRPGLYVVRDGALTTGGQSAVRGEGVSFYLTGQGASFDLFGGAEMRLVAPMTGEQQGMLVVQDRLSNPRATSRIGGRLELSGAVYAPTQTVVISGEIKHNAFLPVVADEIKIAAGAQLALNASQRPIVLPLPRTASGGRLLD